MGSDENSPVELEAALAEIDRLRGIEAQLHEQIRTIMENSQDVIWSIDLDGGRWTYVSPSSQHVFGYAPEKLVGRPIEDFLPPASKQILIDRLHDERNHDRILGAHRRTTIEIEAVHRDGHKFWVESTIKFIRDGNGLPVGVTGVSRDISHRRAEEAEKNRLRDQLRQARKMEAIGTLAGGIAHDFNNILSAVMGNIELAQMDLPAGHPAVESLDASLRHILRAKELTRRILAFSRDEPGEVHPVMLGPMIEESLKLIRSLLPDTIAIEEKIDLTVSPVLTDPTDIRQLFMNFCTNAFHAMETSGGTLCVELAEINVSGETTPDLKPGTYARWVVSDTGQGMNRATMDRLFDPYFTTKPQGKGSGLGLAVARGMVEKMGGIIRVESQIGIGSRFEIWMPCQPPPPEAPAVDQPPPAVSKGRELILLAEDDPDLNTLTRTVLERLGYRVDAHVCPQQALQAFHLQPDAYDLLITDWSMPEMRGDQLASSLLAVRPNLPVILCTGYSENIFEAGEKPVGIHAVLSKPLSLHAVSEAIQSALRRK